VVERQGQWSVPALRAEGPPAPQYRPTDAAVNSSARTARRPVSKWTISVEQGCRGWAWGSLRALPGEAEGERRSHDGWFQSRDMTPPPAGHDNSSYNCDTYNGRKERNYSTRSSERAIPCLKDQSNMLQRMLRGVSFSKYKAHTYDRRYALRQYSALLHMLQTRSACCSPISKRYCDMVFRLSEHLLRLCPASLRLRPRRK